MSTDAPDTIVVRIAVVVDDKGRYNASGWSGADDPARWARDGLDRSGGGAAVEEVFYIEAEVPRPRSRLVAVHPADPTLAPQGESTRR